MPSLDLVVCGPDMTAVHSAMIVRTLAAFGLHIKSYTIFQEEKGFGGSIWRDFRAGKRGQVDMETDCLVPLTPSTDSRKCYICAVSEEPGAINLIVINCCIDNIYSPCE